MISPRRGEEDDKKNSHRIPHNSKRVLVDGRVTSGIYFGKKKGGLGLYYTKTPRPAARTGGGSPACGWGSKCTG